MPVGALASWKLFFITGHWDTVHPAAMVILCFAVVSSFVLKKSFCGWFCPIGTLSEWLWKLGERIGWKTWKLHKIIDIPLRLLKYLLLGFFIWVILIKMPGPAIKQFLASPYYKLADAKMLFFFIHPSIITIIFICALIILSFKIKLFWCRYLCPYGAFLGFFSMLSPTRIERNTDFCIDCKQCSNKCPQHLPISEKKRIISAECIGCLECVDACPEKQALSMVTSGLKIKWTPAKIANTLIFLFLLGYCAAQLTGYWHSDVGTKEYYHLMELDGYKI
ncbi:MAG: 4Fe-4S binding protein [Deltaproteobacteria bacterium]|nr:4Fe-4S binding protein [Deltaproteobacteria bacterium]MBW2661392.1 4Fe-4S binding protein [Deltaproteobacteria bacterium]